MTLQVKIYIALAILLLGFGSGFGTRAYIASKEKLEIEVSNLKADKQEFKDYISKTEQQVAQVNALQAKLYTLDSDRTKDLNEQLSENDRLRGDLATAQRMHLTGTSCPRTAAAPGQTDSAGGVGSNVPVALSGETRQAVWDLRQSVIRDIAVIRYYQGYTDALGAKADPPLK